MNDYVFERRIINIIILSGISLALIQFFYNRSLWLDEAYLALNIIHRNYFELFQPLDLRQVAPILFLQIEKLFSSLFNNTEYGLRLFPLVSFIISVYLFFKINRSIFKNDYTIIFSLSLFVFNITVINYATEVKQYMSDIMVLILIYYLALKTYKSDYKKYYILGITGIICIFLSNVTPIILFTIGVYLLYDIVIFKKKKLLPYLISISIAWVGVFLLYYVVFINNHPTRDIMIEDWIYYRAFLPLNPFKVDFYKFLVGKIPMVLFSLFSFGKYMGYLIGVLMLVGILFLVKKKDFGVIILSILPLMLHLILSGFQLYPFHTRLILYTIPLFIIIASYGFNILLLMVFDYLNISRIRILSVLIPVSFLFIFYSAGYPISKIEIKESMNFLQVNMENSDRVYVNWHSSWPFKYYQDISRFHINNENIVFGQQTNTVDKSFSLTDMVKFNDDLNLLQGRVWFVFTSVADEAMKKDYLIKYCDNNDKTAITEFHTKGSDVYLFDFSD